MKLASIIPPKLKNFSEFASKKLSPVLEYLFGFLSGLFLSFLGFCLVSIARKKALKRRGCYHGVILGLVLVGWLMLCRVNFQLRFEELQRQNRRLQIRHRPLKELPTFAEFMKAKFGYVKKGKRSAGRVVVEPKRAKVKVSPPEKTAKHSSMHKSKLLV